MRNDFAKAQRHGLLAVVSSWFDDDNKYKIQLGGFTQRVEKVA